MDREWTQHRVRDYLEENPGSTTAEIAEALEISTSTVSRYLRDLSVERWADWDYGDSHGYTFRYRLKVTR